MPRIRTIQPNFAHSNSIMHLSRDARLLFVQLWTLVDDAGRSRALPAELAAQLYALDTMRRFSCRAGSTNSRGKAASSAIRSMASITCAS